jgi:hypothetical protein
MEFLGQAMVLFFTAITYFRGESVLVQLAFSGVLISGVELFMAILIAIVIGDEPKKENK